MSKRKQIDYQHVPQRIITWIEKNIDHPIKGFEHKRNPDGTLISKKEQMLETQYQLITIASYFIVKGRSESEIIHILEKFKE